MMSEQEALVPLLMAELRSQLTARIGAHEIRAEGGEIVVTCKDRTARVDIPEIQNLYVEAFTLAGRIETLLTDD
jgi:hypothetical protein